MAALTPGSDVPMADRVPDEAGKDQRAEGKNIPPESGVFSGVSQ